MSKASDITKLLLEALQSYWGYDSFRPLQEKAMTAVLSGRDSLVVFPTGGGKSLCFQAPAVCCEGLAVVVSPLISLMKDQVDALNACGVNAACLNSAVDHDEQRRIENEAASGKLQLLYLAPERLVTERTRNLLGSCTLAFFAIDEAHCVSQWGHDFRPEYRELAILRKHFPKTAIHAYTATATETVRADIVAQLRLEKPEVLVSSFDRPNLIYSVARKTGGVGQIADVVKKHKDESGIVYCITRKSVESTCEALNDMGLSALPYHAGLSDHQRRKNQDAFIKDQVNTVVATVAFGMGIDKSNVRYVVHAGMPKSLEGYQQESGRAGRDGLEADCCLFYSGRDYGLWKHMVSQSESEGGLDGALESLNAIYRYCGSSTCRHQSLVEYFGETWKKTECGACDVCLGLLEQVDDPLIISQKIISCVVRIDQRFGADYLSLVLHGSKDQRIVQNGHEKLSTWGLLADQDRRAIRDWTEQLVGQGFLEKMGEYNVVQVTENGWRLLKGELTPRLSKPSTPSSKKKTKTAAAESWDGVDKGLFTQLRELRKDKATERQVPAYVIFNDASLREMARIRPSNSSTFYKVHGVGEKKMAEYGEEFIRHIRDYCQSSDVEMDVD